ncbi:MAG TPA: transporter substrate-binding domain-containing protein [Burkholderiaceae bacterium]|jgi:polar amino acid transport system substrate-binding protein|nr:transporter substrate-binding domain-containing protein [Burkholderiaceae bacterium]
MSKVAYFALIVAAVLGVSAGAVGQTVPAGEGDAVAPEKTAVAGVTQAAPVSLGLPYVVPPHVPGAKVRTPEGLAPLLAEQLARSLPLEQVAVPRAVHRQIDARAAPATDILLLPLDQGELVGDEHVVVPTGYRAGVMAIMRTDTDIRSWEDLRGRTVCLTEGGGLVGQMQARHGAIEKVFRAPADALLDLRIGGCDAAVHDSTMLEAVLAFPEWKKFSARLPVQREKDLAFILPKDEPALIEAVQSEVRQWRQTDLLARLTRQSAQDIAFEVYLDQEAPDCH